MRDALKALPGLLLDWRLWVAFVLVAAIVVALALVGVPRVAIVLVAAGLAVLAVRALER